MRNENLLSTQLALVTGAARGLGLEVCKMLANRGIRVIATSRMISSELRALAVTCPNQLIECEQLDVTDGQQIHSVLKTVLRSYPRLDILINNAGVYLDRESQHVPHLLPIELLKKTLDVNLLGAAQMMEVCLPHMIQRNFGRIVNVSSGMGRNVEMAGDAVYYRTSKAALIALTRCIADRVRGHNIIVNAVCPGWVRTRMGGPTAVRSLEQGATGIVAAAFEAKKSGVLLRDAEDFGW